MDEDPKTRREGGSHVAAGAAGRGDVEGVRVTAPAGTRAAQPASPSGYDGSGPKPQGAFGASGSAEQFAPRTVGGQTARFLVADASQEPGLGSMSSASDWTGAGYGGSVSGPKPQSADKSERTVTGTMRLPQNTVERLRDPALRAGNDVRPFDPAETLGATTVRGTQAGDPLAELRSPISVAVGLIFLAFGSMLGFAIEGRVRRSVEPGSAAVAHVVESTTASRVQETAPSAPPPPAPSAHEAPRPAPQAVPNPVTSGGPAAGDPPAVQTSASAAPVAPPQAAPNPMAQPAAASARPASLPSGHAPSRGRPRLQPFNLVP